MIDLAQLEIDTKQALTELIEAAQVKANQIIVVGCSSSEVVGEKIGTAGSLEVAEVIFHALQDTVRGKSLFLAFQCCEHLNRALVVEEEMLDRYSWSEVSVVPQPHAGGSLATVAYREFHKPVMVEQLQAHLGLDIGQTLIGMHLQRVAVPVRLSVKQLGNANLTAARTRPPLIGGARAQYENVNP